MQRSQLRAKHSEGLGSLAETARMLQARGTNGDTILAHINPEEARLLDRLADGIIDGGGRNPSTGLASFGNTDGESGRSEGDANAGGVGGGPTGGQTGGGIGGNTEGGLGGLGGGYGGAGEGDRGAPSSGENVMGNPEMGGGRARSMGLQSVEALGPAGKNVNAAAAAMAGRGMTMSERARDAIGWDSPGGVLSSPAANVALGLAASAVLGPAAGTLASVAHNVGMRGLSLAETAPSAIGGYLAGGLGSLAGKAIGDAITGRQDYDATMSQADRDAKDKAGIESARAGTAGTAAGTTTAGATAGTGEGAGAGTSYVMDAPAPKSTRSSDTTAQPAKVAGWDEDDFLKRNPEVAEAVSSGTWASGAAFNEAYRAQAGASYEAAKAVGAVSPYTDKTLKTRPGQAVFPVFA